MNKQPFFTIGIPTYNRSKLLRFSILSALRQDFSDFEILIIDNNSTDDTESMVKGMQSKTDRIRYYKNQHNNGGIESFIKLFTLARGKYLFFLCDDDMVLKHDTLSGLHKMIAKHHPGFIKIEALFYQDTLKYILKAFRFQHSYIQIDPHDPHFIPKTFDKFIEFWSGSIYKLDTNKYRLLNGNEWLYTSLKYIFSQIYDYGAIFTSQYQILGRYLPNNNLTNLIEPNLSLDVYLETAKGFASEEMYREIDSTVRISALSSIINIKLYATRRQYLLYLKKIFTNDRKRLVKIHFYAYAVLVYFIPLTIFRLLKNYYYHPLVKKETLRYIQKRKLNLCIDNLTADIT